jgi:hypothetical protein
MNGGMGRKGRRGEGIMTGDKGSRKKGSTG